jgi:hypothetical protein
VCKITLLEELKDDTRDYWLVPTSPTGNTNHPDLKIIMVQKGANIPEIELWCAETEKLMIEVLES